MSQEDEKTPLKDQKALVAEQAVSDCAKLSEATYLKLSSHVTAIFDANRSDKKIQLPLRDTIDKINCNSLGPIQIIEEAVGEASSESNFNHPPCGPQRRYECCNYETCLKIAAALNWDSFTCHGCCGKTNEHLLWRAQHAIQKDKTAKAICDLPDPRNRKIENITEPFKLRLVSGKSES